MTRRLLGLFFLILSVSFRCHADEPKAADPPPAATAYDPRDDSGKKAVLQAISEGNLHEVKRLILVLDPRVIGSVSNLGAYALDCPNPDVTEYLRDHCKIIVTDLQLAVMRNNVKDVRSALERIAKARYINDGVIRLSELQLGWMVVTSHSPLMLAVRKGNSEISQLLIAAGADVHESTMGPGHIYHTILNEAIERGHVEIARLLIEGGANVNAFDEKWYYAKQNDPKSFLLSMDYAKLKPEERSKRLKESGELVFEGHNYDVHLYCPLFTAIGYGDSKMVAMLLDNGANPNVFTEDGTRPLNVAVRKGNPDIVRLLLKHGAQVNAVDKKNVTALWWCENLHHHRDIANILREAGAK